MLDTLVGTRPALAAKPSGATPRHQHSVQRIASKTALGLLGEVLARLPNVARPVVQIVAGCRSTDPRQVARNLAVSAAERSGRTLLISQAGVQGRGSAVRGLAWLMSELRVHAPDSIMPDSMVSGLYHAHIGHPDRDTFPLDKWLSAHENFEMVIVASQAIAAEPGTIATAVKCHGSILAVTAGITRLEQVLSEARQLTSAGAHVLGTVLLGAPAPPSGWPWLRRDS